MPAGGGECTVQWAMVYIAEAHAADTWPLKFSFERPRPASLAERLAYAAETSQSLGFAAAGFRLLVDSMDDRLNAAFGAWPTAYYALDRAGRLLFIGEEATSGADAYDVRGLFAFVASFQRNFSRRGT